MNIQDPHHDAPLVTIGITCFNAAKTIGRAIESALAQSWPNTEILVIDDHSQDTSVETIKNYTAQNAHIRLIENIENKGVSRNRQILLNEARGEYLAYFDDDDWSFPDRIKQQYERLKTYHAANKAEHVFCYGDRIVMKPGSEDKTVHGIGRAPKEPSGMLIVDYILGNKQATGYAWGAMGSGTMMGRVETFKKAGGFDPDFRRSAEIDLVLRAADRLDIHLISVAGAVIHQHVTPTADKSLWKRGKYQLLMIVKHWRLVLKRGLVFRCLYPFTGYFLKKLQRKKT